MADVNPRSTRAQMLLIAALALALVMVSLALLVNSAIFTENLATSTDRASGDVGQFRRSAVQSVGQQLVATNEDNAGDSFADLVAIHYTPALDAISERLAERAAVNGRSARVELEDVTEGTRIADDDETGAFVPRDAPSQPGDWTVAPDSQVRSFHFTVHGAPSATDAEANDTLDGVSEAAFVVQLTDGAGDVHRVAVYDDGSGVELRGHDEADGTYWACEPATAPASVDVIRGTVNGTHCRGLATVTDGPPPYTVEYRQGDTATGTYSLTVDRTNETLRTAANRATYGDQCSGSTYFPAGDGSPFAAPAVFSSTVSIEYASGTSSFSATPRVAPDLASDEVVLPAVSRFEVVSDDSGVSGSDASFTVEWEVTDPNADLSGDVVDVTAKNVPDGDQQSPSDPNAAVDSWSFTDSDDDGEEYEFTIVATDDAGHTRSVTVNHVADGDLVGCLP